MAFEHAQPGYDCLLCHGVRDAAGPPTVIQAGDIVRRDALVTAAICSHFYGRNPGHVIVVPNRHFENLYSLPPEYAHAVIDVAREVALDMKRGYGAEGITLRQNNEPAGSQTAFHFHLHVYPRYVGDGFDGPPQDEYLAEVADRAAWASRLRGRP